MTDETEKPKRKYIRRIYDGNDTFTGNHAIDSVIHQSIIAAATEDDGVEVEDVSAPAVLGAEPVSNSLSAKLARALGYNKSMKLKPWKGVDRWQCEKCSWETFDKQKANQHAC